MKKYIKMSLIFMLILSLSMITSCQKKDSYNKTEFYRGNITIVTDGFHESQIKLAADEFKKSHKYADLNIRTDNNFESTMNNYDIISVSDENVKYIIDKYKGNILDLTSSLSDYRNNIISNKLYNGIYKGKVYAVPWESIPRLIVYRKDIFKSRGINAMDIKTWQDYINIGKKLSKETGKYFTGNDLSTNDLNLMLANQLGTSYFNDSGKLDFESERWSRILGIQKQIYSQNTIINFGSEKEVIDAAVGGNILAFIASPYSVRDLMNAMPESKNMWGVMDLPAFEPGGNTSVSLGGMNFIVNKNSKNARLASAFIKFILMDDKLQLELLDKYGRIPVYRESYYFKDVNKSVEYFDDKIWTHFINSQQRASNIEYTKYFPEVKDKLGSILNSNNIKNKDTKTIVSYIGKILEKSP
ncbi:MAG: extracellular solute-binding protein [Clostridium sp.]|jgi:multiple sugar transport system substrate-binding protein|uniref:ABC transporter substrate-binding protein n=1 Tax=Clostridium sp. TaxID=1506 RepID=UPI0025B89E1F|nr:extracellular solute-binding protein [Clostridium sp.]MCH3965331.1 extracellular solute-binding protein [Clostridium sp.]MCI1714552.1 extracellular solute-binding protein [Clostridium sp.]MCI1798814.1 extracellular solute-binding protein [Clostridium sp.]MCI1812455.1 extracellular solute-binding protein [Clostridium sp.]MCI1869624.1 extracellular solute-binding protein [Clostridium sp.]